MDAAYEKYLAALAGAVKAFRGKHSVFVILVAMERLDTRACEALAPQLGGAPVFSSDGYDMYELVSILRCCSLMVSSRYHAMVTSMPALVPSAGVTMDERIRNLLRERGHEDLLLTVDDPDLEAKLLVVMERLVTDADAIRDGIGAFGGAQSENHGAHGRVPRTRGAQLLSGISGALGSAWLGRISSAARRNLSAAEYYEGAAAGWRSGLISKACATQRVDRLARSAARD